MKLNEILGTEFPIIQGGMANIATGEFAAACSNAGALGMIATGAWDADRVRSEIRRARELTDKPFGVNLMLMNPCAADIAQVILDEGVQVVTTGAGNPGQFIPAWKEAGIKVIPVVAAAVLAKRLSRYGVDAFVAEGMESGGHVGEMTTMALVPQVIDAVDVPVIAAGGIADGRQMAAALALGAAGVQQISVGQSRVPHSRKLQAGRPESQGQRHHRYGPLHRRAGAGAEKQNGPGVSGPGEAERHPGGAGNRHHRRPPPGGAGGGRGARQRHDGSGGRHGP